MEIYISTFGVVEESTLVNETPKGYRVYGGHLPYEHVVFKCKQYAGWFGDNRLFYQQRSFTSKMEAEVFAMEQIVSMQTYYSIKLSEIVKLKRALNKPVDKESN